MVILQSPSSHRKTERWQNFIFKETQTMKYYRFKSVHTIKDSIPPLLLVDSYKMINSSSFKCEKIKVAKSPSINKDNNTKSRMTRLSRSKYLQIFFFNLYLRLFFQRVERRGRDRETSM